MPNYATSTLVGHATNQPELAFTANNTPVCKFGLGVNRKWKDQRGEQKSEASFFDIEAWGKVAEILNRYVGKGDAIFLVCEPRQDRWENQEGQKRSKVKFVVKDFQFLAGKDNSQPQQPPQQGGGFDSDDVPFAPDVPEVW